MVADLVVSKGLSEETQKEEPQDYEGQVEEFFAPLKYPGGKSWLIGKVSQIYAQHRHRRWNDRFCGSGALPFSIRPERAVLNDGSPLISNFMRWLKTGGVRCLDFLNTEESYYALREEFNQRRNDPDSADWLAEALFLLNRFGHKGLVRVNMKGEWNVPWGDYPDNRVRIPDLAQYHRAMDQWDVHCGHFTSAPIDPDDFVVLDPPYDAGFTEYTAERFAWSDQVELVHWIKDHPGPVIACNLATPRILTIYERAGFDVELISAPRSISSSGDRSPAIEMFATKNV